jgi:hypothetical protein
MLRAITPTQFHELLNFSEIEPFGEELMDLRFAILAATLVGASGGTKVGGAPYTAADFLRAIRPSERSDTFSTSKQSVEYMEGLLHVWMDGSNKELKESGKRERSPKRAS